MVSAAENQSLPAFIVIQDPRGGPFTGASQWSSGFLPAAYQGTMFHATGDPSSRPSSAVRISGSGRAARRTRSTRLA